jgi:hypothetical protein
MKIVNPKTFRFSVNESRILLLCERREVESRIQIDYEIHDFVVQCTKNSVLVYQMVYAVVKIIKPKAFR